jgi:hypothetical protein
VDEKCRHGIKRKHSSGGTPINRGQRFAVAHVLSDLVAGMTEAELWAAGAFVADDGDCARLTAV